jgi:hypothetical protein
LELAAASRRDRAAVRLTATGPRHFPRATSGARAEGSIWVPALVALLLAGLYASALLVRADGDASLLVHAAPPWTSAAEAPESLTVQPTEDGFDGQFFYRNAADPLSTAEREVGVEFDLPALRSSRIGYSFLAWLGSAGDVDVLPWSLLAINVLAAGALGAAAGALVQHLGRHAAWGLVLVLWPGFAYTLSFDLAELVASAFAVGGLLAAARQRWLLAASLLIAAALTRETALIYAGALGLAGLLHSWDGAPTALRTARPRVVVGGAALGAIAAWQLFIWSRFGDLAVGSSGGSNNLGAPLAGLGTELGRSILPGGGEELYRLGCMAGLLVLVVAAAVSWRRTAAPFEVRLAWIPATVLVLLLNDYQWSGATAFLRGATEAGILSTLVVLGGSARATRVLMGTGLGVVWVASAAAQVAKLG